MKRLLILAVLAACFSPLSADPPLVDPVCLLDMAWYSEPPQCCTDHRDNDNDGLIDHQDPDCRGPQ